VRFDENRILDVYDTNDAMELGSPQAYLNEYALRPVDAAEDITVLERHDSNFRGFPAISVHLQKIRGGRTAEVEELVVYRAPKQIGPLFNIVLLRTTPKFYRQDHVLFLQIRNGLQFVPVPSDACSND
jgi:hypothetical protein